MKISLQRRHAATVENGAFSHKIDMITIVKEILNLKEHQNCITGSTVTEILLKKKNFFLLDEVVKLVGGRSVINNGAYPV